MMEQATTEEPAGHRYLLTGGTGMLGQALAMELRRRHIDVLQATRRARPSSSGRPPGGEPDILWNPQAAAPFADTAPLEGLYAAIHLSGANVAAKRWTPAYKQEIRSSRTETTAALARTLAGLQRPPKVLLTASATGIYGDRGDEVLTEASSPGHDFLAEACAAWEAAAEPAKAAGIRVVHLRYGVVLTPAGGALQKVLPLFRAALGGRLGSGRQWMSWITLDDAVEATLYAAGNDVPAAQGTLLEGPVNCVTPYPATNAEYTRALGAALHRPALAAAPAFALRLAVGEMADAALLSSCRAMPRKLIDSGFRFRFPEIGPALAHLLSPG